MFKIRTKYDSLQSFISMLLNMNLLAILLLVGCFIELSNAKGVRRSASSKILSRKRRYVTFPEGSSFSVST